MIATEFNGKKYGILSFLHLGHIGSCNTVSQLVVLCVVRRHLQSVKLFNLFKLVNLPIYAILGACPKMELQVPERKH